MGAEGDGRGLDATEGVDAVTSAIATRDDVLAELFKPVQPDKLTSLFDDYDRDLAGMAPISRAMSQTELVRHFMVANLEDHGRGLPSFERLGQLEPAIKALDAHYWQRALDLTDVLDSMPQARRDQWHSQIEERKVPPFERSSVLRTLQEMLDQRVAFFAERVDGIFQALSREHLTNRPEGFSKRMIIARAHDGIGTNYQTVGYIHDLRCVVAKLLGRDEPRRTLTIRAIEFGRKSMCGKWVELDGGALRVRVYKIGTAHLEVHEEVAWRLNQVLAYLHPGAIPAPHRERPRVRQHRDYLLFDNPIAPAILDVLANGMIGSSVFGERCVVLRRGDEDPFALAAAERVLVALGGQKALAYAWQFNYPIYTVINLVISSGKIPDGEAHQYYPTPREMAERMVKAADIKPGERVLEPSAGQGHITEFILTGHLVAVEVSDVHCAILRASGVKDVRCDDFLTWRDGVFAKVVMNPPFAGGRAIRHLEHAATMVAPGGRIVALLPAGLASKDVLPGWSLTWSERMPFPGTSIEVVMLVAEAPR